MWWSNRLLLNQIQKSKAINASSKTILFLGKANDIGSGEDHHAAIRATNKSLDSLHLLTKDLYKYKFYSEEDHGSVVVPAEYDALRFIFTGSQMPVKAILKDPDLLTQHFEKLSSKYGFSVIPELSKLDKLKEVSKRQKNTIIEEKFKAFKNQYYPDSN
jgi:hypothetical protein